MPPWQGKVSMVNADMDLSSITAAGRRLEGVSLQLLKSADRNELAIEKVHGSLAGGQVAGEVHPFYPDNEPSRYLLSLVVRNADLQNLVQGSEKDLKGLMTASLSLEGGWDTASRRGRGDVVVTGKELYHLPLLMGLFQVTNLSLPIATPFKNGTARFSIDGQRMNFERVDLRSDTMLMSGEGYMDFGSKKLR